MTTHTVLPPSYYNQDATGGRLYRKVDNADVLRALYAERYRDLGTHGSFSRAAVVAEIKSGTMLFPCPVQNAGPGMVSAVTVSPLAVQAAMQRSLQKRAVASGRALPQTISPCPVLDAPA